jgi:GGDEF domain-containing protein
MNAIAAGFWGGFFATALLLLCGSLAAFVRSEHRVALAGAASAGASALYAASFLRWLPISDVDVLDRFLAHVAVAVSALLAYLLVALLGMLREREFAARVATGLTGLSLSVLLAGWALEPEKSLLLGCGMACVLAMAGLVLCLRATLRGDRFARLATLAVACMLVALLGLGWIALNPDHAGTLAHMVSALAASAYLAVLAALLWQRYSYLIELHEVMAHGPSYDPVTRMRSHAETGQMVGAVFHREELAALPLGVIVISVGNLYALEKLHGQPAVNHALFVCAGRLRRCAPANVEMGRLGDDAFLLLVSGAHSMQRLIDLAHRVVERLSRPVILSTRLAGESHERDQTRWEAQAGVGVLAVSSAQVRAGTAVAMAKAMSRTAWSYPSRVAWFDEDAGQISELSETPIVDTEPAPL